MREFTGWIQGRPEDYIMNLQRQQHRSKAQSNTRKTAVGPKLNLFSPGIKNDYEYLIKKQNEVANFTYKKGRYLGVFHCRRVKCSKVREVKEATVEPVNGNKLHTFNLRTVERLNTKSSDILSESFKD